MENFVIREIFFLINAFFKTIKNLWNVFYTYNCGFPNIFFANISLVLLLKIFFQIYWKLKCIWIKYIILFCKLLDCEFWWRSCCVYVNRILCSVRHFWKALLEIYWKLQFIDHGVVSNCVKVLFVVKHFFIII